MPLENYTTEQRFQIITAQNENFMHGRPEVTQRIKLAVSQDLPFAKVMKVANPNKVKPEPEAPTTAENAPNPPPTQGKGSSAAEWQKFAKQVSTMDHEVIESMSRADIIKILEAEEII